MSTMNKTFTYLSIVLLGYLPLQLQAQHKPYSKIILSATLSTQGAGADIKFSPTAEFGIRTGISILPFNWQTVYTGRSKPTDLHLDADFANTHLMFDWHPFLGGYKLSEKIVVTAGGAYWWKDKGTATISYQGTYKYGDIEIDREDLGVLKGTVQWKKITPYLGFGFENVFPSHKFNLGFAIGTYYMGKPDAILTGTKMLAANTSNSEQFEKNMSYYRFLPIVQINLNFSL